MKKTLNTVLQKKDWVLLAALVVAIVALVLLITPKEETVDTITVIPPPAQLDVIGEDVVQPALVAAETAAAMPDISSLPMEERALALKQLAPDMPITVDAMAQIINQPSVITDVNLAAEINRRLNGRPAGTPISEVDLSTLLTSITPSPSPGIGTSAKLLNFKGLNITSIQGLEKLAPPAGTLLMFDLSDNRITDLSPLQNLTSIIYLNFSNNQVSDLKPLANMRGMEELYFSNNKVTDIGVVAMMPNLHSLNASDNQISSAEALKTHYMMNLDLSNNRLGKLVMDQYMASPTTYPIPTPLKVENNYININDPRDFAVALKTGTPTLWPQYKMDMFDMNNNIVMYIVEMGSEKMEFQLLQRRTTDGVTFEAPGRIPDAAIVPAYPKDGSGKEEKHVVDFTYDPATGRLTAIPKSYGEQYVTFYLNGADGSYSRVTVDFHVLMSK